LSTKISILIPTYNEAKIIRETLGCCVGIAETETIVVDGGSVDGTAQIASEMGAQVFSTTRARSRQMNLGASKAKGRFLLFLHADTHLPENFKEHILNTLRDPEIAAGAFQLRIKGNARFLRLIERGAKIRSRLFHVPYGDQAIFLRASTFERLQGFKEIEIMEDLDLVRRLGKLGRIVVVNAPVVTSARRWNQVGIFKTTLINQIAVAAYCLGVSRSRISAFYRKDHSRSECKPPNPR
jgi:rSAM/selenodomain-associated transferase 2